MNEATMQYEEAADLVSGATAAPERNKTGEASGTPGSRPGQELLPLRDRVPGPRGVQAGEQAGGRGAAPGRGQELGGQARVDPREPAPGMHQVDDPNERIGAHLAGERLDELVVVTGQLV